MSTSRTIMVVNPNTTAAMTDIVVAAARRGAAPGTRVVAGTPARGPAAVETNADEAHGALAVLEQVCAASGVDAFVVACFGDTGVAAAREAAAVPVVGMTEAARW